LEEIEKADEEGAAQTEYVRRAVRDQNMAESFYIGERSLFVSVQISVINGFERTGIKSDNLQRRQS
jgi:hypothetical protein